MGSQHFVNSEQSGCKQYSAAKRRRGAVAAQAGAWLAVLAAGWFGCSFAFQEGFEHGRKLLV